MGDPKPKELRRRSLVKALLWRVIGVVWTWVGAYIILLFVPPSRQSAALIATLIVVYHHSTRMIMYYVYERIWTSVGWGHAETPAPMSKGQKFLWATGTALALAFIFFLLLDVHPRIKEKQAANNEVHSISERTSAATSTNK
ncbi:MAG: DUF2061 domain-containing protein [Thermodesulfobacteriota bacterium]|nr:DUF2061 domain-containing protein [Thermodesulfobacteriota bacterium]